MPLQKNAKIGVSTWISVMMTSCFYHLDRERPKYQIKDDAETPRNGPKAIGEGSDTVKVTRDSRGEETVRARWVYLN